jgi:hypothetical protein
MTDIKILYDKIYSDGIQKPPKVFIDIYEENKNLIESADTSTSNPDYDGIMRITGEYGMALSSYGSSKKSLRTDSLATVFYHGCFMIVLAS